MTAFAMLIAERIRRMAMPPGYNGILVGGLCGSPEQRDAAWAEYDARQRGEAQAPPPTPPHAPVV